MKKLSFIAAIMALFLCGCEKNPDNGGQEPQPGTLSFSGTMTVVFRGETVPSEDVEISVSYEEDGTLSLLFNQVKFVPQMPVSLDVKVAGIKYIYKDGVVTFAGDGIVPTYGLVDAEMPEYTVTGLTGTISGQSWGYFSLLSVGTTRGLMILTDSLAMTVGAMNMRDCNCFPSLMQLIIILTAASAMCSVGCATRVMGGFM